MSKRLFFLPVLVAIAFGAAWALVHYGAIYRNRLQHSTKVNSTLSENSTVDAWARAVERVKEPRGESELTVAIETPPELRHYSDRHWFLAAQVAEIAKHNVRTCEDFLDLAGMLERRELVAVPAVTENYVLFGVGQKADDSVFSRYRNDKTVALYNEAQLAEAYRRLDEKRSKLESELSSLRSKSTTPKTRGRSKNRSRREAPNENPQLKLLERELQETREERALLDQYYGKPEDRRKLFRDYESLVTLARNFAGHLFNIEDPSDRLALKLSMLSSLRPEALKIMEEIASIYHRQFARPLPISSLVRPEQYQHALRRVNRNAVLIETPPHTTGLAFDIDYRYMSPAEQTFLMAELARLKNEGRIEVIRESNANYHVFAFVNGTRPNDELIAASLDKAQAPVMTHHASTKPAKAGKRSQTARRKPARTRRLARR